MTPDGTSSLRSDLTTDRASTTVVEGSTARLLAGHDDAELRPHATEVPTAH